MTKGVVVSLNKKSTVIVKVTRVFRHPRFLKTITRHKRFSCQLPENINVRLGQLVVIKETSPKSATKSWLVVKAYD